MKMWQAFVALLCGAAVDGFVVSPCRRGALLRGSSKDDEGYAPIGSLIRQGPVPFLIRIVDPEKYERSVVAYMAKEGCSRKEAQGNMDAYFENPTSWALQKMNEKDGVVEKYDYANANTNSKQLVLTLTWAAIVFSLGAKIVFVGW